MSVRIWTDGSCYPNPGEGGWAFVIEREKDLFKASGYLPVATNNIAEMTAALQALSCLDKEVVGGRLVEIFTDSAYLANGMNKWTKGWIRRKWRTTEGKPVANDRLWKALVKAANGLIVHFTHVRGHTGLRLNEMADRLAGKARKGGHGISVNYGPVPDFVTMPFTPVAVSVEEIVTDNPMQNYIASVG